MIRFGFITGLFAAGAGALLSAPAVTPASRTPVLLELFTSEGCSSCPPADRLLESLDRTQPIPGAELIVLSEHVDYWNRLGWTDPFSSSLFSARQQEYANRLHRDGVYTPQLVVDGESELVGSDSRQATAAIERALHEQKIAITISKAVRSGNRVTAEIEAPPTPRKNRAAVLYVVLADSKTQSSVARGENAGRALAHVSVARVFTQVSTLKLDDGFTKQIALAVQPGVGVNGLRVVAFLQDPSTGHVLGAALQKL